MLYYSQEKRNNKKNTVKTPVSSDNNKVFEKTLQLKLNFLSATDPVSH